MSPRILVPTATIVILAIILALLPVVIKHLATSQVEKLGLGELAITNVDFNPATLTLVVDDFQLNDKGQPYVSGDQLRLDLAWLPLFSGQIGVQQVALGGGQLWIRESAPGEWHIAPAIPASGDDGDEASALPPFFLDELILKNSRVHIEGQKISGEIHFPNIDLNDLATIDEQAANTLTRVSAGWGEAEINVTAEKSLLAERPPFSIDISITNLPLSDFEQVTGLPSLAGSLDATLSISGVLTRSPLVASNTPIGINVDSSITLSVSNLQLQDPSARVDVALERAVWEGRLVSDTETGALNWTIEGNLAVEDFSARQADDLLAQVSRTTIERLSIDSDLAIGIGATRMEAADLHLTINENGQLLPILPAATQEPADTQATETSRPNISLGEFTASGSLQFTDRSASPPVKQQLALEELFVGGIDSANPTQPTDIRLRSSLDEYSRIDIDSQVTPLSDSLTMGSTVHIKQVPLGPLSVYLSRAVGYEVRTGQLDLDAELSIQGQQVDTEIDLMLRKFAVSRAETSDLDGELGMSLPAALNLVRDGDDNIRLKGIRISGDLNDPEVSARKLVMRAMSKALLAGSVTYFKFALQPYGAALMAAQFIGKKAGKVSLDPLAMQPGTADVASENADYIERLADLMNQRPALHLVICGEASTQADLIEAGPDNGEEPGSLLASPELLKLADNRSAKVKAELFARDITSDRLLICKSSVNDDPSGARVVLAIE